MKNLIVFLFIGFFANACFGQVKDLKGQEMIKKTTFIDVYKIDRDSPDCDDKKDLTLVDGKNIHPCFRFKKRLNIQATTGVVKLFLNKSSFEEPDQKCFTTDFAMVLFDENEKIIGTITMSLICNNLLINNTALVTLTNKAKNQLLGTI